MRNRIELQGLLEGLVGKGKVYFQAPTNIQLVPPYLVYDLEDLRDQNADNIAYLSNGVWSAQLVTKNPDDLLFDQILDTFNATYGRHFVVDQLHHFNFTIYF